MIFFSSSLFLFTRNVQFMLIWQESKHLKSHIDRAQNVGFFYHQYNGALQHLDFFYLFYSCPHFDTQKHSLNWFRWSKSVFDYLFQNFRAFTSFWKLVNFFWIKLKFLGNNETKRKHQLKSKFCQQFWMDFVPNTVNCCFFFHFRLSGKCICIWESEKKWLNLRWKSN